MVGSTVIIFLVIINVRGVGLGSFIQSFFTLGKLSVLGLVIVVGFLSLHSYNFYSMTTDTIEWNRSFSAAVPAMLAFGGYYVVAYMGGEIKKPQRNIPLAMGIGMGIVIVVNVLINISCIGTMGYKNLAGSTTPVVDAGMRILGPVDGILVTFGALISIFGALNSSIMTFPRVAYAMSEDNMMFGFFSKLHPKYGTPYVTIVTFGVLSLMFLWTGSFSTLLMLSVFAARFLECIVALCLFALRKKFPDLPRPTKMPGYPVTTVITICITSYLVSLVDPPQILSGIMLMMSSLPAYYIFKYTFNKTDLNPKKLNHDHL